ncbi:MAG: hypothetical protein KJZ75_08125 [Hyphomonadaceae bacterium]|mgnify:CR=1 FL=1|nr:hypothetical protein [Hyphomonadaceae bacterium]GIK48382.1 MAG: hypothetical protein BroJett013_10790 [Alphaproteobacteria bacterium]
MNTYNWQGAGGRWYEFEIVRAQRAWEPVGGLYMFVKPPEAPALDWGGPISLFIARTDDFSKALARHDMWQAAENLGAREIHILAIKDEQTRQFVEKDLLEAQQPILNRNMLRRVA